MDATIANIGVTEEQRKEVIKWMLYVTSNDIPMLKRKCFLELIGLRQFIPTDYPNVIVINQGSIKETAIVVGDIHGKMYDMCDAIINWLNELVTNPNTKLIFLGDIPDRGPDSIECILLVLKLQLEFPKSVFYVRGNHEESGTNARMGL